MKYQITVGSLLAAAALMTPASRAAIFTLQDQNSTASVDPESQQGMFSWTVDGTGHLFQQWFWYRLGDHPEESLDALTLISAQAVGNNGLSLKYEGVGFTIDLGYTLTGGSGGSLSSLINESITINNLETSPLDFHFFQYSDFDLSNTSGDDTAQFVSPDRVRQWDSGFTLSETVVSPSPSHWEIAHYADTRNSLNDMDKTVLSDGQNLLSGDVTWAFEWDQTIAGGGSFRISKEKQLSGVVARVPDVGSTGILLGVALGMMGVAVWRSEARRSASVS